MGLHKLTAGDGYAYLTRQVAAHDTTEKGHSSLEAYYSQKGESPGRWMGCGLVGLSGLEGVEPGSLVSTEQMKALFGEGRHPNATAIEQDLIAASKGRVNVKVVLAATRLGRPFRIYAGAGEFRVEVARRFTEYNKARGARWNAPIPDAERARIRTEVGTEMFTEAFDRPPADARELSGFIARASRQQTTAVAGYDLTFSPVKSVSALWATAPRQVSEQIQAAHDAAVTATLAYLEREVAFTRRGRDGVRQVEVRGLIATAFVHRDSRAGDPDLHTHLAVSNKVQTVDGAWLALDGRVLYKATVSASEHYNTTLEAELGQRLGLVFTERQQPDARKRPVREVVGVDDRLLAVWSTRRAAIDVRRADLAVRFQAAHGRPPTPVEAIALAQQATLETREAKHEPRSLAEQRATWRAEAAQALGRAGVRRMLRRVADAHHSADPAATLTDEWVAATATDTLARVQADRAAWQVWHVRAEGHRLARADRIPLGQIPAAVAAVTTAALARCLPLGADDPIREPGPLRRSTGESVYTVAGAQLFTSRAVLDAEARLVAAARRRDGRRIDDRLIDLALLESTANRVTLNDLQAQLVRELATSGARLQVAIAPAGSGKTTAMRVLSRAWVDGGGQVIGLAQSAAAAAQLGAAVGQRTDTLAKLTWSLTFGMMPRWARDIGPGSLVIIDEAGMAGTADLAQAVDYVLSKGGSVRLVGDDQQLASIAAGGVLRDIAHGAGVVTLSQLMRFADPAEAAATLALRNGDEAGLGFYLDQSRVHVGHQTTVTDHAYRAWHADRAAGLDAVMLAPTRDLVAELNQRARADRIAEAGGQPGREVTLGDGNQASTGDVLISRENKRDLRISATDWVKNGDRWTALRVHRDGGITARHHGSGRKVRLPADYVADQVDLGYAATVHTAQGITADACHTVADGGETRQLFYVAMTRGRQANHVWLVTAGDGDAHAAVKPETLFPATATDLLSGILARDQAQRSATTLTRELADPALQLRDAAARYHDALGVAAETHLGPDRLAGLESAGEAAWPGLVDAPAWPTLRAHLALLAVAGHDPATILEQAVQVRELATAGDPAAVLDWRLHPPPDPAGAHHTRPGPLPWLPAIPDPLRADPTFGDYLIARAVRVHDLAGQVTAQATAWTPTTAPPWAARLLADQHRPLRGELAVWRAATGIAATDRRPTGGPQLAAAAAGYQADLDTRASRVLGSTDQATSTWTPLADRLNPRISWDPHWPELADRLTALTRAGIDAAGRLTAAVGERPLPDDLPAAALWWRLSRHLAPASTTATGHSGAATLRPTWTGGLTEVLGPHRARRVLDDPAWPALVAAVTLGIHDGWQPHTLLDTAARLAGLHHDDPDPAAGPIQDAGLMADSGVAEALVWRVALLTDPDPIDPTDPATPPPPPDPADQDSLPPADLDSLPPPEPGGPRLLDPGEDPPAVTDPPPHVDTEPGHPAATQAGHAPVVWVTGDPDHDALYPHPGAGRVTRERVLALNQQALAYYTAHYRDAWAGDYLTARLGTDPSDDHRFAVGYAPGDWTGLTRHLRAAGATDAEILAAGLGRTARTGRVIDAFRDRLMFPIHGPGGQVHGFIGRRNPALTDDTPHAGPKYLNTPETDLFAKGAQLLGLHEARDALTAGAVPVLVEGPIDALAVTLAGDGEYVGAATLGTAFTDRQADQLAARLATDPARPQVIVATDADEAGQRAAERDYWQLTGRGANPHHLIMADGYDPAQTLEEAGPAALRAALAHTSTLAHTLIDQRRRAYADRLHEIPARNAAVTAAAEIIGALHPGHWTEQIERATTALGLDPGALAIPVFDAGHAWGSNPQAGADRQLHRLPQLYTSRSGDWMDEPRYRWMRLANSIDPRLTHGPDWPTLADTIERAADTGTPVHRLLPRLATQQPSLPDGRAARELTYRLLAATDLPSHPAPSRPATVGAAPAGGEPRQRQQQPPPLPGTPNPAGRRPGVRR